MEGKEKIGAKTSASLPLQTRDDPKINLTVNPFSPKITPCHSPMKLLSNFNLGIFGEGWTNQDLQRGQTDMRNAFNPKAHEKPYALAPGTLYPMHLIVQRSNYL